jgi:hypothetical protein
MGARGWDRQAYLAQRRAVRATGGVPAGPSQRSTAPTVRRPGRLARFGRAFNAVMDPLMSMAMYSNDPRMARDATVYTAQRELQKFKEGQAADRALAVAQRDEDLAHEEQRMRMLGRAVADEMVRRVEEQRQRGGR